MITLFASQTRRAAVQRTHFRFIPRLLFLDVDGQQGALYDICVCRHTEIARPKISAPMSAASAGSSDAPNRNDGGTAPRAGAIGADAGTPADWTCVGPAATYSARQTVLVRGRRVTVLRLRKRGTTETRWVCMDATCYHAGGPLGDGPLVTAGGRTCLQCPWHSYLIDVFSGEGLYKAPDGRFVSKGARQRTHDVEARADGKVYVRLRLGPGAMPSDDYAHSELVGRNGPPIPSFP